MPNADQCRSIPIKIMALIRNVCQCRSLLALMGIYRHCPGMWNWKYRTANYYLVADKALYMMVEYEGLTSPVEGQITAQSERAGSVLSLISTLHLINASPTEYINTPPTRNTNMNLD